MSASSDRWQRLEGLFYEAVELEPAARKAFLEQRCAGDDLLREEVESLLASSEQPIDFIRQPIERAAQQVVTRSAVLVPGTRFGRYEVISAVGAGGMGEVYLARDSQLRRNVALKLLPQKLTQDERALKRFEQEAYAASALNHPNIITLYDFGQVDGAHYIASEFVEGETLRERINEGKMPVAEITEISIQVCSALVAAHARGIVHRDIKPANLIVRNDGIVKLLDFGIAKLTDEAAPNVVLSSVFSTSHPNAVVGTFRYMSPEQARGRPVDGRSDLFSLGTVMYQMATGQPAFQGETASDIIAEILKGEPLPLSVALPEVPPQFEAIVAQAMRKNREERYQSAQEMLEKLQEFQDESEFRLKLQLAAGDRRSYSSQVRAAYSATKLGAGSAGDSAAAALAGEKSKRLRMLLVAVPILVLMVAATPFLRKRWFAPVTVSSPRTLAVLPFRDLRSDPQIDFLGFSLADAIITKLGYVKALTVRPSSSVDKYRNQVVDPRQAAADLHVDALLTGSYLKDGDDLRITAQLIEVNPGKILWQDTIDMKYDRLLTVEDTVSQHILSGLEVSLSPAEKQRLQSERPLNAEAYEYYLRGVNLYSLNDFAGAIGMLEKAAAIDPDYASTWAHLGRAYTTNASLQFGGREQYAKAQSSYEKALALNPDLIEARVYMANLLTDTGQVEKAVPMMRSLIAESPGYAEAHWELGYAYRFGGLLKESAAEAELARQNNPTVKMNSAAMNAYLYLGEYDKFMQSLPSNDSEYVTFYRGFGEYHLGHLQEAAADFDRAYAVAPTLLPADVGKALSYEIHGERSKGLALLHATEQHILESGVSDAESLYKVAEAYAVLGDNSSAILMLHRTIEGGFFPYPYFERDPLLAQIRHEPEFSVLMNEARERYEKFKAQFS